MEDSKPRLSSKVKDKLAELLRCCFAAEMKHTNRLAGREVASANKLTLTPFSQFLNTCLRQSLNPFHVMRVEFNRLNIGDSPPSVKSLYNPGMRGDYRQLTIAWSEELPGRLRHEWIAVHFCVQELSETLDCPFQVAAKIALADGRLPIVLAHAIFHTFDQPIPKGSFGEALKTYAQSPAAHAKAAASIGLEIPRSLTKYGPVIKAVG